jgi:TfoX/Sxy family transcriptional regulator of competence genes
MTSEEMVQYLLDQLDDPDVSAKSMFGGRGIYRHGRMFALVYGGLVYMKVTKEEAKTSDRPPFRPRENSIYPTFREVFAEELEDPSMLASLARKAQEAASAG